MRAARRSAALRVAMGRVGVCASRASKASRAVASTCARRAPERDVLRVVVIGARRHRVARIGVRVLPDAPRGIRRGGLRNARVLAHVVASGIRRERVESFARVD